MDAILQHLLAKRIAGHRLGDLVARDALLRVIRFGLVGIMSTLSYALMSWCLGRGLGWPVAAASGSAYGLTAIFSYCGHRRLTFRSREPHRIAVPRFALATSAGYVTALVLPVLLQRAGLAFEPAIAITCLVIPPANFILMDRVVFRARVAVP